MSGRDVLVIPMTRPVKSNQSVVRISYSFGHNSEGKGRVASPVKTEEDDSLLSALVDRDSLGLARELTL